MKNKFIKILFIFVISINFLDFASSEEFTFEVSEVEIKENGNIYRGIKKGKITTDNNIEIISNNFEYLKNINRLEANGSVQLTDFKNDIKINAEKIFYLKDYNKISTLGETLIKVSEKYTITGHDLTLLNDKMILSSNKQVVINDNLGNIYKLNKFEYFINQEILKGEKIEFTNKNEENYKDTFSFEHGFFDLKKNKFLAKDINIQFHKTLFGNEENDPRITAVSAYNDESNTYFEKGVFTSCKKTDKCPPWKFKSEKIKHDRIKKQIVYKNAWLEIYDYPIIYFPKFFHPDPSVKRQSGFLKPGLSSSENLGNSIYTPYFYVISDDKDITIKPRLFSDNKLLLQNEYRQITKNSYTVADFSFVKGHNSAVSDKKDTRTHFFINNKMNLGLEEYKNSVLEINYEKTSNDNYLKLFDLESPLLLKSNDVLESIVRLDLQHENYDFMTSFEMYETLDGLNSDRYEYVLPAYNFSKNFDLQNFDCTNCYGFSNGSFNFNSYGSNILNATNVSTSIVTNDLNYISYNNFFNNGIKTNYSISLKNVNSAGKNNPKYKTSPQSELMSAYLFNTSLPLKKKTLNSINTLEPKVSLRFSPNEMKDNKSLERRIDINNIYNVNRLSLDNSYESGESLTVGINFKKEKIIVENEIDSIEEYLDFRLATVFRVVEEKNIPSKSTLNKKNSNIFGQLNYKPTEIFSLDYSFSLKDNLETFEYNSLNAKLDYENFSTQFNFLEEKGAIGQTNVIENITKYNFNKENALSFKTRKNRNLNLTEYYDLLYEYKNDCLTAGIQYKKNYYSDADIKPVEELLFNITIVPSIKTSKNKKALK